MAIVDLVMPKMGESIMEATILKWYKNVGDHIQQDETLLDIATDKVDSEVPSSVDGIIKEILFSINDVVAVGTVIAKIETTAVTASSVQNEMLITTAPVTPIYQQPLTHNKPAEIEAPFLGEIPYIPQNINMPAAPVTHTDAANNSFFSPLVLNIANSEGISLTELEKIKGTGEDGRVTKKDILQHVPENPNQPKSTGNNRFFSPLVLNIANSEGLSLTELEKIIGTGADGRVSKKDVLQYIVDKKAGVSSITTQPASIHVSQPVITQPTYNQPLVQPTITEPVSTQVYAEVPPVVHAAFSAPSVEPQLIPQQPIASVAVIPEPVVVAPEPVAVIPEPVAVIPAPVAVVPAPVAIVPAPVAVVPAPVAIVPEPVAIVPEPVAVVPEPVAVVPEPVVESKAVLATSINQTCIQPVQQSVFVPTPAYSQDIPLTTLAEGHSGKFANPTSALPTGDTEIIEMDRMRKLIAKHMVNSVQTSPHVTSFVEADVTNMVLWRNRVKDEFERREGTKITFTPMFIESIVKVMKQFPLINSSIEGDTIVVKKDFNIGMATALPGGNLIVPVIKSAEKLNIVGLSKAVNNLAVAARNKELKPDDTSGGTFTFTNVGTFGSLMGTPIINQPQVAILAVGVIKKRPVVIESADGDTIGIRHMMYLSLSYDHRVIDGSVGASFLTAVAKELEQWDVNRTWYQYT